MNIGLDLGNSHFRSLRRQGNRLIARASRTVYAVVLDNPARRAMLAERGIAFAEFGMNLIVFGDTAEDLASQLRLSTIPLCVNDRLQLDDKVIRQVMSALIEGLLPMHPLPGTECCLTMPAGIDRTSLMASEFLMQLIRKIGYEPRITSAGLAVALSELAPAGVCGIGIHLGEMRCEISMIRHGRELARFEIPRGIGMIDDPQPNLELALREIFATGAFELNRRGEWKSLATPISIAVAGDVLSFEGGAAQVKECILHASWPFAIGTVHVAADPGWAVCRGCLIQAELEHLTAAARSAA